MSVCDRCQGRKTIWYQVTVNKPCYMCDGTGVAMPPPDRALNAMGRLSGCDVVCKSQAHASTDGTFGLG